MPTDVLTSGCIQFFLALSIVAGFTIGVLDSLSK